MNRQVTYLNAILTLNAVLLAGLLWTQIASSPMSTEVVAQSSFQTPGPGPDPGRQRVQMIQELQSIRSQVMDINASIKRGLEVRLSDEDSMTVEIDYDRLVRAMATTRAQMQSSSGAAPKPASSKPSADASKASK